VASGAITKIPGIGKGTQALVKEFVSTGALADHAAMRAEFPSRIFELLEVRGLGPKKARALYQELAIGSLAELEYACEENRLVELKGFGAATQASILKNIQKLKTNRGKAILPAAQNQAEGVREELLALKGIARVEETGELRRLSEVVASLDFVAAGEKVEGALEGAGFSRIDDGSWRRVAAEELTVRVWVAKEADFGSRLFETTGPLEFVAAFGKVPAAAEEAAIFASAGRAYLPPECRDLGASPEGLIEEKAIRGVFHLHTTWSDGKNTLAEMAAAAAERGLEYLGVSEHSQTAFYANGLDAARVRAQKAEIAELRNQYPKLKIFHGIESDILPDGSLDFPPDVLAEFDFVIASVHGQMKMGREEMTARLCRALENPATTWLGHWSGRLLLGRDGYDFDQEAVLDCAARHGKGIELNSNPYRLDVDWRLLPSVVKRGIPVGIFPDAHSVGGLEDFRYGVQMARKAGLTAAQVVNTKSGEEMEQWLRARKN
jgi:DNA polymerase (family 10)